MKLTMIGAVGALAALSLASQATAAADDDLSYDEVATCAAFVLLEAQVYDGDNPSSDDKAKADNFYDQSAALIMAAAIVGKREAKDVTEDVKAINLKMIDSLAQEGAAARLLQQNGDKCNAMGQAAQDALHKK